MVHKPQDSNSEDSMLSPITGLHSDTVKHRLNQIDQIRSLGIGDSISLPQLVVCGDQSSGKSSVLTGVTGIPFPRQEGTCTRFATEIIIRHDTQERSITASVIPDPSRKDGSENAFKRVKRILDSFDELPSVIRDASEMMGIKGYSDLADTRAFAADVLRIEVVGDTGLSLTVVDLPGLISVPDDEDGEEDVRLVGELVDGYLMNPRTIILAVVQATNDIQNQRIIQRARKFDRAGERTIGIITKPDLINKGTEGRIARLANNQETTKLSRGFFLVKNPSPESLDAGITIRDWQLDEQRYFTSRPWSELKLDSSRVGVENLRIFLEKALEEHIERELPRVRDEISSLLQQARTSISELGVERSGIHEQRQYLLEISMEYFKIVEAALDGRYQEVDSHFFGSVPSQPSSNRLRARVDEFNMDFAAYMRDMGEKRKVVGTEGKASKHSNYADNVGSYKFPEPQFVSKERFNYWVENVYKNTRGLELPGNDNHVFMSELFHEQSSRWPAIASRHVRRVHEEASELARRAIKHIVKDKGVSFEILKVINRVLDGNFEASVEELQKICEDEKIQPITYNHYYTDNIQKARSAKMRDRLRSFLERMPAGYHSLDARDNTIDRLLAQFDNHTIVDMNKVACENAKDELDSYYKVAMKTFVDNICRQVLERHILRKLQFTFYPTAVGALSNEKVTAIASESREITEKRQELVKLARALEESLELLTDSSFEE